MELAALCAFMIILFLVFVNKKLNKSDISFYKIYHCSCIIALSPWAAGGRAFTRSESCGKGDYYEYI